MAGAEDAMAGAVDVMTGWSAEGVLHLTLGLVVAAVLVWPGRRVGSGRRVWPGRRVGRDAVGPSCRDEWPPRPRRPHPRRVVVAAEGRLADLLGLVAAPLRAGVPATTSLEAGAAAVADDRVLGPLLQELVSVGASGEPVSSTWRHHAALLDSEALRFVGQAWALSERTGAPLADALTASEQVLRARVRSRERLASAAAGPRASMTVLALLPLSGPVVGLACGISPRDLYLSTTWSTASLVAGVVFAGFGWWWSRSILARAA
ncbi:hypothetical protein ASC58_18115 [Phycicoccus sp. Root101]|nr:hypothetical protein ASC58_18115 [Phycicoccus sp. Root101]